MTNTVTIKQTRANLADLINQVDIGKTTFIITKFGKPKAKLVPISDVSKQQKKLKKALDETFGGWKERTDIKDTAEWVADLRSKMSRRDHE